MAVTAGDVREIIGTHPQLGDFTLRPVAGESFTYDPGGFRNNDDNASIDGGGRGIYTKTRQRWSVEGPISHDMNDTQEMETLRQLAAQNEEAELTFEHINGVIHQGKGTIVGDIQPDVNTGQISVKFAGGGELTFVKDLNG